MFFYIKGFYLFSIEGFLFVFLYRGVFICFSILRGFLFVFLYCGVFVCFSILRGFPCIRILSFDCNEIEFVSQPLTNTSPS